MADVTEAGTPGAGGQLSGEASRAAAIKRLQKIQQVGMVEKGAGRPRAGGGFAPRGTLSVNTGPTGLPKAGGAGLKQTPGLLLYSPHPPKPRRI